MNNNLLRRFYFIKNLSQTLAIKLRLYVHYTHFAFVLRWSEYGIVIYSVLPTFYQNKHFIRTIACTVFNLIDTKGVWTIESFRLHNILYFSQT